MTEKELEDFYNELHATISLFWGSELDLAREEMDKELGYLKEIYRLAKLGLAVEQWPDDYAIEKYSTFDENFYWRGESISNFNHGVNTPKLDSFIKVIECATAEPDPTPEGFTVP